MATRFAQQQTDGPRGTPEWMTTYTDIMSLLTTFFILLLTFSTLEEDDFTAAKGALRKALGVAGEGVKFNKSAIAPRRMLRAGRTTDYGQETPPSWDPLRWEVEVKRWQFLKENDLGTIVRLENLRKEIAIIIRPNVLFYPRSDQLKPESSGILKRIASIIKHLPFTITVQGYDDDLRAGLPSNRALRTSSTATRSRSPQNAEMMNAWQGSSTLSIRRAAKVVAHLSENGGVHPFQLAVSAGGRPPIGEQAPGWPALSRKWDRGLAITISPERFQPISADRNERLPEG